MLRAASMTNDTPPTFLQLPVVRLIFSGRASLSFFFLLTGFVNSLGFLKQVRAGNQNTALQRLAKSAYRRIGRLVLPATVATTVSWVLCQLGAYRLAREGDVNWFRDISPRQSPDLVSGIWDLFKNLFKTWSEASNDYDKVQWNLFFLLKASMVVYMILLMTTYLTPRSRKICILIYYMYGWTSGDCKCTRGLSIATNVLTLKSTNHDECQCGDVSGGNAFRSNRIRGDRVRASKIMEAVANSTSCRRPCDSWVSRGPHRLDSVVVVPSELGRDAISRCPRAVEEVGLRWRVVHHPGSHVSASCATCTIKSLSCLDGESQLLRLSDPLLLDKERSLLDVVLELGGSRVGRGGRNHNGRPSASCSRLQLRDNHRHLFRHRVLLCASLDSSCGVALRTSGSMDRGSDV